MAAPIMLETKWARPAKLASSAELKEGTSPEVTFGTPTRSSPLISDTQIIAKIPSSPAGVVSTRPSVAASAQSPARATIVESARSLDDLWLLDDRT